MVRDMSIPGKRNLWRGLASLFAALWLVGCAHSPSPAPVFSDEWGRQSERTRSERRSRSGGSLTLFGDDKGGRVAVKSDEREGTRVRVGGDEGVQADVDMKGGAPRMKLRYNLRWGDPGRRLPPVKKGRDAPAPSTPASP